MTNSPCYKKIIKQIILLYSDDKPYWWDITSQFTIVSTMASVAQEAIEEAKSTWMIEDIKTDDPVAKFTKGNVSLV